MGQRVERQKDRIHLRQKPEVFFQAFVLENAQCIFLGLRDAGRPFFEHIEIQSQNDPLAKNLGSRKPVHVGAHIGGYGLVRTAGLDTLKT